jgi:hypothetical protein
MSEPVLKKFRVATFFTLPTSSPEPKISHIRAYIRDYNPGWDDCILYDVMAINGAAAKYEACQQRLAHEIARRSQP